MADRYKLPNRVELGDAYNALTSTVGKKKNELMAILAPYLSNENNGANYYPAVPGTGLTRNDLVENNLLRDNMTAKGQGFYGNISGSATDPAMTEYSIGVGVPDNYQHIQGLNPSLAPLTLPGHRKYYDAPSIVPGMTADQLSNIMRGNLSDEDYSMAEQSAIDRQFRGQPVFASDSRPVDKYPKRGGR